MTDAELKQQPRSVRDEFEQIRNSVVDGDQEITHLKTQLDDAAAKRRESQLVHDNIRGCIKWLPDAIARTENEIEEIKVLRVSAIAAAIVDEKDSDPAADFSADDVLITQLKDAELYLERLQLSVPGLEQKERAARRACELASNPCITLEERLNHRRDQLKLAEARRRHGY